MSWGRIKAVFLRYFYFFARLDHLCDLLFWPALDIFIWGMTSIWIQQREANLPPVAIPILTGLVFWQLVWRSNYEISVNLLQELWSRNLVNLFSTPLTKGEWVISLMLVGFLKVCMALLFGSAFVYLLYVFNIFSFGWAILPFVASLLLSGWWIGFLTASVLIYFGQRLQQLAWMTAYGFSPFSAVFYPVSALPTWAQKISQVLPMSYLFEGMRKVLKTGEFPIRDFQMSLGLNLLYLTGSMLLFRFCFEKSRVKGLSRLE